MGQAASLPQQALLMPQRKKHPTAGSPGASKAGSDTMRDAGQLTVCLATPVSPRSVWLAPRPPATTAVRRGPLQPGWLRRPSPCPLHPDTGGCEGAVTCLEPALRSFSPAQGPPCTSACRRSTSTGHHCCPHPAAPHGGCPRPSPEPPPDGDKLKSGHIVTQNMMTCLRKHPTLSSLPTMPQQQCSCSSGPS